MTPLELRKFALKFWGTLIAGVIALTAFINIPWSRLLQH